MRYITRKRRKRQGLGLVSETFEALGKGRELVAVHRQTKPPHPPSWGVIERPRIVGPAPAPPPHSYQLCCAYTLQAAVRLYCLQAWMAHHLLISCWGGRVGGQMCPDIEKRWTLVAWEKMGTFVKSCNKWRHNKERKMAVTSPSGGTRKGERISQVKEGEQI